MVYQRRSALTFGHTFVFYYCRRFGQHAQRIGAAEARWAHNPKVLRSKLRFATLFGPRTRLVVSRYGVRPTLSDTHALSLSLSLSHTHTHTNRLMRKTKQNKKHTHFFLFAKVSGYRKIRGGEDVHARRDSNPQPPDSKSDALSIAPRALLALPRLKCPATCVAAVCDR